MINYIVNNVNELDINDISSLVYLGETENSDRTEITKMFLRDINFFYRVENIKFLPLIKENVVFH